MSEVAEVERQKLNLQESLEMLTVAETRAVERHYGKAMEKLTGTDVTVSAIWAHERRRFLGDKENRPDWSDFDNWTMKQVNDYFAPEEMDADPDDPDSDEGKDDSLAA